MKAWRNIGGVVTEIEVDIGLDGEAILPPDTTTSPRPEPVEGHYVTVVGRDWVHIPIAVEVVTFETKKERKLKEVSAWREWLIVQPVKIGNVLFDGDEQARDRLTQALVIHRELGSLPHAWFTFDNQPHPLSSVEDLKAIVAGVQLAFSTRFFQAAALRQSVYDAQDEAALEAIVVPSTMGDGTFVVEQQPPAEPPADEPVAQDPPVEDPPVEQPAG